MSRILLVLLGVFLTVGCKQEELPKSHSDWLRIEGIPEKMHGEYHFKPETNNESAVVDRSLKNNLPDFMVGNDWVVPLCCPEANWKVLSVDISNADDRMIRILSHTANQPESDASYIQMTMIDAHKLRIDFSDNESSVILIRLGPLKKEYKHKSK